MIKFVMGCALALMLLAVHAGARATVADGASMVERSDWAGDSVVTHQVAGESAQEVRARTWRPIIVTALRGAVALIIPWLIWASFRRLKSDTPFESDEPPHRIGALLEIVGVPTCAIAWYFGDAFALLNGLGLVLTGRFLYFGQRWAILSSLLHLIVISMWVAGMDSSTALKVARAAVPFVLFLYIYFVLQPRLGNIQPEVHVSAPERYVSPAVRSARTAESPAARVTATPVQKASSSAPAGAQFADPTRVQQAELAAQQLLAQSRMHTESQAVRISAQRPPAAAWLGAVLAGVLVGAAFDPVAGFILAVAIVFSLLVRAWAASG